jgi:hypothetical protein
MARSAATIVRRLVGAALLALVALAVAPVAASAAQPATLRLLDTAPGYRSVTVHSADGRTVTGSPGMFLLRATVGGVSAERNGFCVDLWHGIAEGRDYEVSATTAAVVPGVPVSSTRTAPRPEQARGISGETVTGPPMRLPAASARSAATRAFRAASLVGPDSRTSPTSCQIATCRAPASRSRASGGWAAISAPARWMSQPASA